MAAQWSPTDPPTARSAVSVQALTEAAPAGAADGIDLSDVLAAIPVLHAPPGQTFTAGVLLAYFWTGHSWVRAPRADVDLSGIIGLQDGVLPTVLVDAPRGRLALIASGIALSGAGAQVTLELLCVTRGVEGCVPA